MCPFDSGHLCKVQYEVDRRGSDFLQAAGARGHVVDLDAARSGKSRRIPSHRLRMPLASQFNAAGVRTVEAAKAFDVGVSRCVIGTAAVKIANSGRNSGPEVRLQLV